MLILIFLDHLSESKSTKFRTIPLMRAGLGTQINAQLINSFAFCNISEDGKGGLVSIRPHYIAKLEKRYNQMDSQSFDRALAANNRQKSTQC